ncbi:MAG: dihydrofolate reductase family protein, partial [Actinobacteria bacterium]|nr:dihydrofolate reductase family protein [Actinomycetota bacterium]
ERDYASIWREADKVVYSKTLQTVASARTRLERDLDPTAVRRLKAGPKDLSIGGPHLAAAAFKSGLIDECQLFLVPVIVGGGTKCLPNGVRQRLDLVEERPFAGGVVYLRYRIAA